MDHPVKDQRNILKPLVKSHSNLIVGKTEAGAAGTVFSHNLNTGQVQFSNGGNPSDGANFERCLKLEPNRMTE